MMRHAGIGFPNGPASLVSVFDVPSPNLLILVTEARFHHDEAVRAGKSVLWRAIPNRGKRPAEVGWSPARAVDEALNLIDTAREPIHDFVPWNELDLRDERGDGQDDYSDLERRYNLLGGFLFSALTLLRQRLPGTRLHFPAFTPDHDALLYVDRWRAAAELADVIDIHAYDSLDNIRAQYEAYRAAFPAQPLALTEWHCKGDLEEERRVLTWLADTMAADPLFDAAYFFIWRWWDHPGWWSDAWDIEHNPDRYALFMSPPVAVQPAPEPAPPPAPPVEPPMPDFPIPVDDAGNEWAPSKQDVIDGAVVVADEQSLPRDLMLALCLAESGEGLQAFERWYRFTAQAKDAIARRDRPALQAILEQIAAAGTNDISFGPCHQTWRWSPEYNGNPYDLQAILEMRKRYIQDHGYALRVARDQLAGLWAKYGPDKVETLARYNKPDGSATASVRKRYADMLALAPSLLPAAPEPAPAPAPPSPSGVVFEDYRDPEPAGTFAAMPRGVILHGSRSGKAGNPQAAEYLGTARYEQSNTAGLGWHVTVADDRVAVHLDPREWGWHALQASKVYLGCEFAQPTVDEPITDAQVDAFCAWFSSRVQPAWPGLPLHFPSHAEADREFGVSQGKTDAFPLGDPRMDDLRARIMARLQPAPVPQPEPQPAPEPHRDLTPADLASLVGVAYHEDGTVVPALAAAIQAQDWGQVVAVLSFLRSNNPDRAA